MTTIATNDIDIKLAETNINDDEADTMNNPTTNTTIKQKDMNITNNDKNSIVATDGKKKEKEKKVARSTLIAAYRQECQKKYAALTNDKDAVEKLNTELRRLFPLYKEVDEKMRLRSVNLFDMEFETLKPFIEFRILQQVMQELSEIRINTSKKPDKMIERSKKITAYTEECQRKYFGWIDKPNAAKKLNTEGQKLMPRYMEVHEKMRKRNLSMSELDFESLKPLIAYRNLQQAMKEFTADAIRGSSKGRRVAHGGRSRGGLQSCSCCGPPTNARGASGRPSSNGPPKPRPMPPPYPPPGNGKKIPNMVVGNNNEKRISFEKDIESFDVTKRDNVINFLKWAKKWLESDELQKEIQLKCKDKEKKEKERIIYDIFEEGYNKEWIKSVEKDLNIEKGNAENRLMFAYEKYVSRGTKDYFYYLIQKLYKAFQKAEDGCFHIGVYGSDIFEKKQIRDKKIREYRKEAQEKYINYLNENDDEGDDIDRLNDEFMRLVPIYRDLREKIRSGKIDPAEMDFETVKPMIEFQALERIMDLLANDQEDNDDDYYINQSYNTTHAGPTNQAECYDPCCQPLMPTTVGGKKKPAKPKTFKRKIQTKRNNISQRSAINAKLAASTTNTTNENSNGTNNNKNSKNTTTGMYNSFFFNFFLIHIYCSTINYIPPCQTYTLLTFLYEKYLSIIYY